MHVVQNPLNQLWYIQKDTETNSGFAPGAVFESEGYKTQADAEFALANGNYAKPAVVPSQTSEPVTGA